MPSDAAIRKARRLAPRLEAWFAGHARDLPWRRTRAPYAIWVSEIMLQQTQVATVIPFWQRWMRALPSLHHLARAQPERVLKLWEGLGYYSRARNLQAAAKQIMAEHGGRFPTDPKSIRALPGIGRYTVGAISSIALGQAEPIVDGNVIRILTRLFGLQDDPKSKPMQEILWALAEQLVKAADDCGALNQSLMELGATVCHPRAPACERCPVARSCVARRKGIIHLLPAKPARPASVQQLIHVYLITHAGRMLLQQRPEGFHNAGFWELPNDETCPERSLPEDAQPLATARHTITRYRIELWLYAMPRKKTPGQWHAVGELDSIPMTAAHRKLLSQINLPA